jgi:hypothetical protein
MDAYRKERSPAMAAYIAKQYHGHRMIPNLNGKVAREVLGEELRVGTV